MLLQQSSHIDIAQIISSARIDGGRAAPRLCGILLAATLEGRVTLGLRLWGTGRTVGR